jgi:putative ATPase
MKELDYGKDYKYAHNYADAYVPQEYLPEEIKGQIFYQPKDAGFEKTIKERINAWRHKKNDAKDK